MNDEQIEQLWERVTGFKADDERADIAGFARALIAASASAEPVAWKIDCPEEPELGHWLDEEPDTNARSVPLYAAPRPAISDDHATTLYKLAHMVGSADWIKEFRKSLDAPRPIEAPDNKK